VSAWSGGWGWAPRKSVADRRADAERHIAQAAHRGKALSPVRVSGRTIAHTFWGKAWCDNLERYRDFAYRLERGRSYLRSGSVIDLQIAAGKIAAQVSGSDLYDVAIQIDVVASAAWRAIQRECAGGIASRIDLLAGKLSEPVMARLCADRTGLFPAPSAIQFSCSCPDYAAMCKHVAAVMYGVGARLDHAPELLFTLRKVALEDLVASAVTELPAAPAASRVLASEGLGALFGLELDTTAAPPARRAKRSMRTAASSKSARTTPPAPEPAPPRAPTTKPTSRRRTPTTTPTPRELVAAPRKPTAASPAAGTAPLRRPAPIAADQRETGIAPRATVAPSPTSPRPRRSPAASARASAARKTSGSRRAVAQPPAAPLPSPRARPARPQARAGSTASPGPAAARNRPAKRR